MIDANHCPGSAMLLITGPLGTLFHTGDFRFNGNKMMKQIGLHRIDYMYLDNTFSIPKEKFPTQDVAYEKLRLKIENFRSQDKSLRYHLYCYTLGKEEVFVNLAKDFNTKIVVCQDRMNRLEAIGIADKYFISDVDHEYFIKKEREICETEEAFNDKHIQIFVKTIKDRPKTKEDVINEPTLIHFMMTGWGYQYNI